MFFSLSFIHSISVHSRVHLATAVTMLIIKKVIQTVHGGGVVGHSGEYDRVHSHLEIQSYEIIKLKSDFKN